ncbi:hypothetical protein DVH05_024039 [Phytophthora capsici]|nr:hypothetical protein DVH05_024039 [Phytophthora capsici]
MASSLDDIPVLTSVRVVCREFLSHYELSHTNVRINEFLRLGSVRKACINGSLRLMKLVAASGTKARWGDMTEIAAELGHLDILQWLSEFHADRCKWDNVLDLAAEFGHLPVVKWLHTNRQDECSTDAMDVAAHNGNLDVVKWLHDNRTEGCTVYAMTYAAINGHLDVVKWLHEIGKSCSAYTMDSVTDFDVLKWLHENLHGGWLCSTRAIDKAAGLGRLDLVVWLHENRTEGYTTHAIELAAKNGHLDVVKWLFHHEGDKRHYACKGRLLCGFCQDGSYKLYCEYESLYDFTVKMARMKGQQHVIEWVESLGEPECANKWYYTLRE